MSRILLSFFFALLLIPSLVAPFQLAEAQTGRSLTDTEVQIPGNLPTLGLKDERDPIKATESLLVTYVINPIFLVAGGVAVIIIMYASFQIISSRGDEEAGLGAAKTTLTWALVGLGLIIASYTIVRNISSIILGLS